MVIKIEIKYYKFKTNHYLIRTVYTYYIHYAAALTTFANVTSFTAGIVTNLLRALLINILTTLFLPFRPFLVLKDRH